MRSHIISFPGNSLPSVTIPLLLDLLGQGRLDVIKKTISIYKPSEINRAVDDAKKG